MQWAYLYILNSRMRHLLIILCLIVFCRLQAQTYEVGLFAGGANMIGDVGSTTYISPSEPAFGGVFKWNKSKRYAWRGTVVYGEFAADDSKSNVNARQERGYTIDNSVLEFSAGLEVNFVDYNLHQLGAAFTPYLYTGLTYFRYNYQYFEDDNLQEIFQTDGSFAIPMTVGFKYRLSQFFILGAEIGARYTLTDNLDASNPEGSNFESFRFGNILNNDWYVFSGITLTYTFGRKLCSDCFE